MGWGFHLSCPVCRHEWEGVSTSLWFGPWSPIDKAEFDDRYQRWYCSVCCRSVYVPRQIERRIWENWRGRCLSGAESRCDFVRQLATKLAAAIADCPHYVPRQLNFLPGDCPECQQPFLAQDKGRPILLSCPGCQSRSSALAEWHSHLCMGTDEHGFS